jgi:hypothetical protein
MAFAAAAFTLKSQDRKTGTRRWAYFTTDVLATVVAGGYFNTMASQLRRRDVIEAHVDTGGTPSFEILMVSSNSGATPVTVLNAT